MKTTFTVLSAMCLAGLPAMAGTTVTAIQPAPAASPWSCRVSIYGWVEALNGDAGIRGFDVPVNITFSEILQNLDFAFMGALEIKRGRWGFLADINYATIGDDLSGPRNTSLDVTLNQFLGNFLVSYEALKTDTMEFDVYAGARVNYMKLELDFRGPLGHEHDRSGSESWVDPVIGARFQADLGHNFFFRAVGDIGGFGAASDFTWQAMAGFGYSFHEHGSLLLAYRAIGTDYTNGGFTYDVTTHGPVIGYEFKF